MEVGHALTFGPDRDIFVQAMHKAAADAIRNIRLVRSTSHKVLRGIIEDSE
jgi:tRNA G46 methylase TrmB